MEILNQLSSQKGDKTEIANRLVAEQCIANPKLLAEIAIGFEDKDKKLQSDCIEVFTFVSEVKPEFVVPYADIILPLLCRNFGKSIRIVEICFGIVGRKTCKASFQRI